jgi:hypothetical protein
MISKVDANKFDEKMVKDLATLRWDKLKKLSLCTCPTN